MNPDDDTMLDTILFIRYHLGGVPQPHVTLHIHASTNLSTQKSTPNSKVARREPPRPQASPSLVHITPITVPQHLKRGRDAPRFRRKLPPFVSNHAPKHTQQDVKPTAHPDDDVPRLVRREDLPVRADVGVVARARRPARRVLHVAVVLDVLGHAGDVRARDADLVVVVVAHADGRAALALVADAGARARLAAAVDAAEGADALVDAVGVGPAVALVAVAGLGGGSVGRKRPVCTMAGGGCVRCGPREWREPRWRGRRRRWTSSRSLRRSRWRSRGSPAESWPRCPVHL